MTPTSLEVTYAPTSLLIPAGLALALVYAPTSLIVPSSSGNVELAIVRQSLTLQNGPTLSLNQTVTTLEFTQQAGAQGPPGPRQIYNQSAEPLSINGYTLLWFQPAGTSDPDDREISLVEYP